MKPRRIKPGKTMLAAAALIAAVALPLAPAHAAGGLWGSAGITSGCAGGSMLIGALNSNSNNWMFDVTVLCTNAAPQHVAIAGSWNAATGGVVTGFGSGSLQVGMVGCGSTSNVTVQVAMIGSPLITGKGTISRGCA